jgi:aspartyl-tRNA(Asn)/glutamyl-tRNA(Gln) amidotransferase subunit A
MNNDRDLTIVRLAPLIRRKKISPVEITRFCLDRIDRLQPSVNAFITITAERALSQAKEAEKEIVRGRYRGALHGIPVSLKDLFHTAGIRTTAGSKILKRFVPGKNAPMVDRLLESGCVLLGKTNMHEFAYGPTNLNPHYGPVRNPWDTRRMSGGSSGGSAAAVVTGQSVASFGTDTGGSIRIPSAACGCVGLKPTYGSVSMEGVIPLSYSLDHAGPLCRCVEDAAILFQTIAIPHPTRASGSAKAATGLRKGVRGLAVGIPRQYFFDHLQPEVRRAVLAAVQVFEELGAELREISLEGMAATPAIAADITAGEALAVHADRLRRNPDAYGEDVRLRLLESNSLTIVAFVEAQQKARRYREMFKRDMDSVSVLLTPTLPVAAPRLDQDEVRIGRWRDTVRAALLSLTRPANISGLPAVSIPCGFTRDGLPIGLQMIARRHDEMTLLRAAYAFERATPWHDRFPGGSGV